MFHDLSRCDQLRRKRMIRKYVTLVLALVTYYTSTTVRAYGVPKIKSTLRQLGSKRLKSSLFELYAKKKTTTKFNAPSPPSKAEKQSRADQFDAVTRKFMFTISKLSKTLPDGSRTILKNINLCFYPGAKIGVVGLNGSGKSTLLKIMAGVEKVFDGVAVPMPGASIGYLPQEPTLEGATVIDNINIGVKKSQDLLDRFNELTVKCSDPTLDPEQIEKVMNDMNDLQNQIDVNNITTFDYIYNFNLTFVYLMKGWELMGIRQSEAACYGRTALPSTRCGGQVPIRW